METTNPIVNKTDWVRVTAYNRADQGFVSTISITQKPVKASRVNSVISFQLFS